VLVRVALSAGRQLPCFVRRARDRCSGAGRRTPSGVWGAGPGRQGMSSETHVPAESSTAEADTRVPVPDEASWWACGPEATAGKGPEAAHGRRWGEVGEATAGGRFQKADRLGRPADFERVRRSGQRQVSSQFVLVVVSASEGPLPGRSRLGVTVSRRVAGAVGRNRIKRRVREWFRTVQPGLPPGTELLVIARPGAIRLSGRETADLLTRLLRDAKGTKT
jgi:ribonuclease P protein component